MIGDINYALCTSFPIFLAEAMIEISFCHVQMSNPA